MGQFSFSKPERLSSKKLIQELFAKGSSFYLSPFKIIFLPQPADAQVNKLLISVPKTKFKKATERNTIKRRIREGYRLNKIELKPDKKFLIAYIYTSGKILASSAMHEKMIASLRKINEKDA
ncbi:MAG: ribonuclease P protein component [Bacteroidetes bacterium]|nr:ribonuclease P protein component [Bacteroidota bacterium]MBS1540428.1 ribonuclease P protein component [Bacteroidota bacterium]